MFICQICNNSTTPREKQKKIVIKKRTKATGWEIEKEINVCSSCSDSVERAEMNRR